MWVLAVLAVVLLVVLSLAKAAARADRYMDRAWLEARWLEESRGRGRDA